MSLEATIGDIVEQRLDAHLARYTRRLAEPECLTYTAAEAAAVIGCSARKVDQWLAAGLLPRVPHIDKVLIPRIAVEAFVLGQDPVAAVGAAASAAVARLQLVTQAS